MNWLSLILGMLPSIFEAATKIHADVTSNDHKQAVVDGLTAAAQTVAKVLPQHATAATDAAAAATGVVNGVYQVLADVNAKPTAA
ncbi:MAG TPA: hypothetical protein VMU24_02330 [Candidatus Acidoferrales bacterium]|nr:hypothetical protein [Candidatus Acidoferrales bacterium]